MPDLGRNGCVGQKVPVHIDYEIKPQDLAAQGAQVLRSIPTWKRLVDVTLTGLLVGLIMVPMTRRSEFGLHLPSAIGSVLAVSLAFIVLQKRRLRQFQPVANGFILGPKKAVLTGQGVVLSGEGYEMTLFWKAIRRIDETNDHLFLWVDNAAGFTIPKRDFADATAKAAFLAELRKHTGL